LLLRKLCVVSKGSGSGVGLSRGEIQNVGGGLAILGEKHISVFRQGSEVPGEKQIVVFIVALGVVGDCVLTGEIALGVAEERHIVVLKALCGVVGE